MRGASVQEWTMQVRKGLIELWLMGHLAQGQSYGYQLGQLMFEDGGQGVRWGTIYHGPVEIPARGLGDRP